MVPCSQPVIACFQGPESRNLNDLVLILFASHAHARESVASRFVAHGAPVTKIGSRRGRRSLAGTAGVEEQFLRCRGEVSSFGSNRSQQGAPAAPDLVA